MSFPSSLDDLDPTIATIAIITEEAARLRADRAHQILWLHEHDGVSLAAIAKHCGVTRQTVNQWIRPYR